MKGSVHMGWGAAIGVVLLTAIAGGCTSAVLANFLIDYQQITAREGAAGYFMLSLLVIGAIGGSIVGIAAVLIARAAFLPTLGYSAGAVVLLTLIAGGLCVWLDDNGPRLDGDKLTMEVELKSPSGWKPDEAATGKPGSFCWMQEHAIDQPAERTPIVNGGFVLNASPEPDGRWLATCAVSLPKTRKERYLRIFIGKVSDVTIQIPLPASPKQEHKQWSSWTTSGFLAQKDVPVVPGYEFRCRVTTDDEYRKAHPDPNVVREAARERALSLMKPDAPLIEWLPFFEIQPDEPRYYSAGNYPERETVRARVSELVPLLASKDLRVATQALTAANSLYRTPAILVEPLGQAGKRVVPLIREARTPGHDPMAGKRAYNYFTHWNSSMQQAGEIAAIKRRALLIAIEKEASAQPNEPHSDIDMIATTAGKALE